MDLKTRVDIDARVQRVLEEMGAREPPISILDVIAHLEVDHCYYNLDDPSFLRELYHKLKVGSVQLSKLVKKVSLQGLWLPDRNHIVVDQAVQELKRKWVTAHEVAHRIIPTHRPFFLADTAESLDPEYHEMLESEANYGASSIIFMGRLFTTEARDTQPSFASVQKLSKRYKNTITSTLRRYVEHGHNIPMLGVVSTPWWMQKPPDQPTTCRYFIRSPAFALEFPHITPEPVVRYIDAHTRPCRGGPVGSAEVVLTDIHGNKRRFHSESFFNRYYLQTLFTEYV